MWKSHYQIYDVDRVPIQSVTIPCHESAQDVFKKGLAMQELLKMNIDLKGICLENACLADLDFTGRDLSGASFKGSILRKSIFVSARLHGANFSDTDLRETDFSRASLRFASFDGALIMCEKLGCINIDEAQEIPASVMCAAETRKRYIES